MPNAYQIKYGETLGFQCLRQYGNIKCPIGKSIFTANFTLKLFGATIANADTESLKFLHTLFDTYLDDMLEKFEPFRMVQNVQNLGGFFGKKKPRLFKRPILTKRDAILQDVFIAERSVYGKLLIFRQLSFSVPKIMVVRHV